MNALIGLEDKSQLAFPVRVLASRNRASNPALQARHCSGVIRSGGTYLCACTASSIPKSKRGHRQGAHCNGSARQCRPFACRPGVYAWRHHRA